MKIARRRCVVAAAAAAAGSLGAALPLASSAATAQPGDAIDGDESAVRRYMVHHGYAFPVTLDAEPLRSRLTARRMVPMSFVIDARGRLQQPIPGEMTGADVLEMADLALAIKG